jgi:hypothetical protein
MKNIFSMAVAALFFTASVNAQSTVDSIAAKYKLQPMPEANSIEKTFPVLGTYQLATSADSSAAATLTISLDSTNKGLVWIEGLPQGRVKAYLRKSPATYRILAQKTESGKSIPEGTLMLDPTTNTLNIALGAPYNDADPAAVFAMNTGTDATAAANGNTVEVKTKTKTSKTKSKVTFYTASKIQQNTAVSAPTDQQQQKQ